MLPTSSKKAFFVFENCAFGFFAIRAGIAKNSLDVCYLIFNPLLRDEVPKHSEAFPF